MQSSILSPSLEQRASHPSPALFTPATVAESQRSDGGGCCTVLGTGGNATLLLNLDTGAALLLGWGWIWGSEFPSNMGQLHYFFFLDLNDQPIVQRRYLCMMCPWNVCCVSLCMMCGVVCDRMM